MLNYVELELLKHLYFIHIRDFDYIKRNFFPYINDLAELIKAEKDAEQENYDQCKGAGKIELDDVQIQFPLLNIVKRDVIYNSLEILRHQREEITKLSIKLFQMRFQSNKLVDGPYPDEYLDFLTPLLCQYLRDYSLTQKTMVFYQYFFPKLSAENFAVMNDFCESLEPVFSESSQLTPYQIMHFLTGDKQSALEVLQDDSLAGSGTLASRVDIRQVLACLKSLSPEQRAIYCSLALSGKQKQFQRLVRQMFQQGDAKNYQWLDLEDFVQSDLIQAIELSDIQQNSPAEFPQSSANWSSESSFLSSSSLTNSAYEYRPQNPSHKSVQRYLDQSGNNARLAYKALRTDYPACNKQRIKQFIIDLGGVIDSPPNDSEISAVNPVERQLAKMSRQLLSCEERIVNELQQIQKTLSSLM